MPDTAYVVRATMMMTRAELHALAKVAESLPDEPLLPGSSWSVQGIIQRVQLGLTSETDEPSSA